MYLVRYKEQTVTITTPHLEIRGKKVVIKPFGASDICFPLDDLLAYSKIAEHSYRVTYAQQVISERVRVLSRKKLEYPFAEVVIVGVGGIKQTLIINRNHFTWEK